jgi:serine/threonine protein kinase
MNSTVVADQRLRYSLGDLLGEGSYGSVYKAFRLEDNDNEIDEYAIKILPCPSDCDAIEIKKEIDLLKSLESPFTVAFIESFIANKELWIVMECCAGGSLQDLNLITSLSEDAISAVVAFATLGLDFLHTSKRVIHRDIKPGNILLTIDGKAKLSDFGVSAQLASSMMRRKTVIGSPYWMAPGMLRARFIDMLSLKRTHTGSDCLNTDFVA